MHVALVHLRHAESGGTEQYLNHMARHLAGLGARVDILCRRHGAPPHPAVNFVRLARPVLGSARRLRAFDRDVARHLADARHDVVYSLGRTTCHDLVRLGGGCHASYLEFAHSATRTPAGRRLGLGDAKQQLRLELEARGLAPDACRKVVVNARLVARDVQARYGIPDERLEVIHNGVDLERFHPDHRAHAGARERAALGLAVDERLLLFLGNGYGRKGLDVLLAAWARFSAARPRWRLLVVGADSRLGACRARARSQPGGARIRFAGPRPDVQSCFAAADLYALPSRHDPFANSTLEALASGVPVLTTDRNGGAEVFVAGRSGAVLAAPGDPPAEQDVQQWHEALLEWSDDARLAEARLHARRAAEAHPIVAKLEAGARLLTQIAETNRGRPPAERFAPRLAELRLHA